MWCHLILLVPLVLAGLLGFLPWTMALPLGVLLAAPTALVAYAGWRQMRQPVLTGADGLRGNRGEAVSDVAPEGFVRLRGELWLDEVQLPVAKRRPVKVIEAVGVRVR